ncbi:hypothetical protein U472_06295 [Orenia metallireducens]|uniref:Magnesium transporter MgtE intracellular domain-containing protein n=1 Tax=Orenia metallireducens TaxID=1413210 RepID=A0A1C0A9W3_9FIRM|nr:hypothetical protein [Orenia metallireducens]OCL27087.1 hypothetical protein U472_06295 [Orenia metallireducens]
MKKVLLGILILLILAGATLFLLDYFKVFTFEDIKEKVLAEAKSIPVIADYMVTKDQNKELEGKLKELQDELFKVEEQNQSLLEELKARDNKVLEQEDTIINLQADIKKVTEDTRDYKAKVKRLADVYAEMEAVKSADILPKLDTKLVIDILNKMDEEIVAEILSEMDTAIAVEISNQLSY